MFQVYKFLDVFGSVTRSFEYVLRFPFDSHQKTAVVPQRLVVVPVSFVHQVGEIQLTLLCEQAEVSVVLEEIQQLGGVGHPEGESPRDALLPLWGQTAAVSFKHLVSGVVAG